MKYILTLTTVDEDSKLYVDQIQAEKMVELCARFPLMVSVHMRQEAEREIEKMKMKMIEDDIPF